jgi:hypothetical protein
MPKEYEKQEYQGIIFRQLDTRCVILFVVKKIENYIHPT